MPKKILVLSRNDTYGDGMLAYRVAKALVDAGYEVAMVVKFKTRWESFVCEPVVEPKSLLNRISEKVSNRLFPPSKKRIVLDKNYELVPDMEKNQYHTAEEVLNSISFTPDLIITGLITGFVNTGTLSEIKKKTDAGIYMMTVGMEPMTGGCHHAWDCEGYQRLCESCPAILSEQHKNVAHENLKIKLKNVAEGNMKVIALSGRTLEQAKKSTLYKDQQAIYNINSVIDTKVFNNKNRKYARNIFDIPDSVKVIFTGAEYADNTRKGIKYFIEALKHLWEVLDEAGRKNTVILIAGKDKKTLETNEKIKEIPFRKIFIDFISDERLLSLAYQAADVFVCPSIEDPGPVMVSQALACGTPVVGFEMGVITNMVINGYDGYKAKMRNSGDLAKGIFEVLSLSEKEYDRYSQNAVTQVEKYSSNETLVDTVNQILN